ncbi:MAG: 4Fe-4S binding protein [Firmicutes bacterium]|nr:4Fe-4S binding protein [Bacillota bacterium]
MATRRVLITFPAGLAGKPLTYSLVKEFDLVINILFARITPNEEGKLILEIGNSSLEQVEQGINFLRSQGVQVETLARAISWNEKECIHCGACTAVCRPKALALDLDSWELSFDQSKCIICGLCTTACPLGILKETF